MPFLREIRGPVSRGIAIARAGLSLLCPPPLADSEKEGEIIDPRYRHLFFTDVITTLGSGKDPAAFFVATLKKIIVFSLIFFLSLNRKLP